MKGYKAFNKDMTCRGFQYEIGKTYELPEGEKIEICRRGFHFCKNPIDVFGYYPMDDDVLIAEVEAFGEIKQEGTKYVTDKIRIVKEFTRNQLRALILDGRYNTGEDNSGDCNSGNGNSGNWNSGNSNSGNWNSGDRNSGNCNSGNGNSGDCNSGNGNSGDWNSGDRNSGYNNSGNNNSGYKNSGNGNSGDWNSGNGNSGNSNSGYKNSGNNNGGDWNDGDWNSGNGNSGDWNSGDWNSGIFNTNEPKMRAFNKQCNMTRTEFFESIDYSFYALCERIFYKHLEDGDKERIEALPNYDADIFEKITGIKLEDYE